jgi:hypothetical protein
MIQAINFASVIGSYLITELGQRSESVPISDGWTHRMEIDATKTGRLTSMIVNEEDCRFGSRQGEVFWRIRKQSVDCLVF